MFVYFQCCGSKYIEFGSGSRSGPGSRVICTIHFERNLKIILEKNYFLFQFFLILYNKNKMLREQIFTRLSLGTVNLYFLSLIFCRHFILYLQVWIRIHSKYRSGSRRLLTTDPILIRIHNTVIISQPWVFKLYTSIKLVAGG